MVLLTLHACGHERRPLTDSVRAVHSSHPSDSVTDGAARARSNGQEYWSLYHVKSLIAAYCTNELLRSVHDKYHCRIKNVE